ncbi:penicillin acylase family protein [Zavarzinia aquatilis]|uniref:Penicillin acylase family protein n=1 Tax=Zavarzinia aquatilis TaxID=2211142 RepID=A0A317E009_9PROT|nr:penicillin acylase family protein [Zavarzinia aquatilis]PWR20407.1 hypothetical protein DKG74_15500 [Zavarzinia aquatilis]
MEKLWGAVVGTALVLRTMFSTPPRRLALDARLALVARTAPLARPLNIRWDERQIPVIEAETDADLFTGLGLVHAHLRLGQIEIMRRVALGRVAEMAGPLALGLDRSLRLFGFRDAGPATIAAMPAETRRLIGCFLEGYNHQLMNGGELPPECAPLAIGREPWNLADFLAYSRLMAADSHWLSWGRLLKARDRLPGDEWAALWRRLKAAGISAPAVDGAGALLGGRAGLGSNSFAVSGKRTESGAGLIASDPHLAIGLPSPVMAVGVASPGFHAAGLMMPGLPFFPVGRNRNLAWGGTNLYAQTSDLFDAADLPIETTTEVFRVRGGRDRVLPLRRCALGPIVSDGPLLASKSTLALRWTGHGAGEEFTAMLAAARARTAEDFRAALDGFALPGLNITHAGRDGRIGHLRAVHVPRLRAGDPADLVLPPAAAWPLADLARGRDLPSSLDPAKGVVVSANEPPPPGGIAIGHFFAPRDRAERIAQLLAARDRIGPDDLRRIQRDVVHAPALALRDLLLDLGAGSGRKPAAQRLFDLIAGWNGAYDAGSAGAAAFEVTLALLARRATGPLQRAAYDALRQSRRLIAEDLQALPRETLVPAFEKALAKAARRLPPGTVWGDIHRLRPGHFLSGLPRIGRYFRAADLSSPGGNDTVAKAAFGLACGRHHVGFGAAVRHLADLGDEDGHFVCLLGGQDGWFGSTTAMDQIALWQAGGSVQLPLRPETVARLFTRVTRIEPL